MSKVSAVTSPTCEPTFPLDAIDGVDELSGVSVRANVREYQERAIQGNATREPVNISCLELLAASTQPSGESRPPTSTLTDDPHAPAVERSDHAHAHDHDHGYGRGHGCGRGYVYAHATHRDGWRTRYVCDGCARPSERNSNGDETRRAERPDYTNSLYLQRR